WVEGSSGEVEAARAGQPGGVETIGLGEAARLPGLIDCHTHLSSRVGVGRRETLHGSDVRAAVTGTMNAKNTLMAGFTTVRDVGSFDLVDIALRDAINEGEIPGPRMRVATWSLSETGGCRGL